MTGINVAEALARFDNDREIYLELIETYLEMGDPDFNGMKELLASGDRNTVMLQIHKLKGGALTIGADELAEIANHLEILLRSETGENPEPLLAKTETAWKEMTASLPAIQDALRKSI